MRKSPFFLLMGYHPCTDWILSLSPLPQVTLRLEQLKQARDTAQQLMIKAQQSWVKHRNTPKYKEGDQVWLEGKNLRINQPTAKLAPRRHGPFKIIKVLSPVSYQLALPTQWSIHPMFHIDLLPPYRETITHGPNYQRPLPDLVDGAEEYSVEKILDSRKFGRRQRLQYLVKWEGYPDSDNMWVDKDDVFADDKVREFKASNPAKETHIRNISSAKCPYPSATTHSHLLLQHASRYMSTNGSDLAYEYTAGAYDNATTGDVQPIGNNITEATTPGLMSGPPLCLEPPLLPSNLDLSLPQPPLSPMPLGNYPSLTPLMLSLTITPTTSLCFESPKPLSLGMRTAHMWHQEQLLEARKKHDLKNRQRRQAGLLPLARCHPLCHGLPQKWTDTSVMTTTVSLH
jgi:hypothetical protein